MNRELLEKAFGKDQVKQRKGRNGATLDYIEGHAIVQRLNEAFEGRWSFEVHDFEVKKDEDEVLVLAKLSADGIVKMQFGSSQITRERETKGIISLGDDFKAASTDALKKCATLLGVGLYLYAEDSNDPGKSDQRNRAQQPSPASASPNSDQGEPAITDAQLRAIYAIGKSRKLTEDQIIEKAVEAYGTPPEMLSVKEASAFIKQLKALNP